eukprot:GHVO01019525.1.p1 GENE.GHVO01019525.1~~GHVO01019525.1.p1  ORF type:complete len:117 (-),score=11.37 GHVO01019525.1:139-489(-)
MDANEEAQNRKRFTLELEFVQSLSNPEYLHALAQKELFSEPAFINYLSYLRYWKKPEYGQFLTFPQCLRMLDALQNPDFREKLSDHSVIAELQRQQSFHWLYHERSRDDFRQFFEE